MSSRRIVALAVAALLLSACAWPSRAPVSCDADDVVAALRATLEAEEAALSRNVLYETRYLNLWFVDPALDPSASGEAVAGNTQRALRDAITQAHRLRAASACVPELWDEVNLVVVDREYNDWVSGSLAAADLPKKASLSDGDIKRLVEAVSVGYMRTAPAAASAAPGSGACTWAEVRSRLEQRFDPVEEGTFTFVIEDRGGQVWAQWAGPDPKLGTDPMLDAMVAVAGELGCLQPPVESLWVVYTDADQVVSLILTVPGEALRSGDTARLVEGVDILYPPQAQ